MSKELCETLKILQNDEKSKFSDKPNPEAQLTPEIINSIFKIVFTSPTTIEINNALKRIDEISKIGIVSEYCLQNNLYLQLIEFLGSHFTVMEYTILVYSIFETVCKIPNAYIFFFSNNILPITLNIIQNFHITELHSTRESTKLFVESNPQVAYAITKFFIQFIKPRIKLFSVANLKDNYQQFQNKPASINSFLYFFEICCRSPNEELCKSGYQVLNRILITNPSSQTIQTFKSYGFTTIALEKMLNCDSSFETICTFLGTVLSGNDDGITQIPSDFSNTLLFLFEKGSDDNIIAELSLIEALNSNDYFRLFLFQGDPNVVSYIFGLTDGESFSVKEAAFNTIESLFDSFKKETADVFFSNEHYFTSLIDFMNTGQGDCIKKALICLQYVLMECQNPEHNLDPRIPTFIANNIELQEALDEVENDNDNEEISELIQFIDLSLKDLRKVFQFG